MVESASGAPFVFDGSDTIEDPCSVAVLVFVA
jgi:hypothetical protein